MTPSMTSTTVQKSHLQTLVDFDEYTRLMEAALKAAIVSGEPAFVWLSYLFFCSCFCVFHLNVYFKCPFGSAA